MNPTSHLAHRWINRFASLKPSQVLTEGISSNDLTKIQVGLTMIRGLLEVSESPGDMGYTYGVEANWFYSLGSRLQKRAQDVLRAVLTLQNQRAYSDRGLAQLEALIPEVVWLEKMATTQSKGGEAHGPITLYTMPGVSRREAQEAVAALDQAMTLIRKHFPHVIYGDVYLSKTVAGALAKYMPDKDVVYLGMQAKKHIGDVVAICHEFGHRYERRFWKDRNARERFRHLTQDTVYEQAGVTPAQKTRLVKEYMAAIRAAKGGKKDPMGPELQAYMMQFSTVDPDGFNTVRSWATKAFRGEKEAEAVLEAKFQEYAPTTWSTGKVIKGPLYVTRYAESKKPDWRENFAEAFAYFLVGKPLPPELAEVMQGLG